MVLAAGLATINALIDKAMANTRLKSHRIAASPFRRGRPLDLDSVRVNVGAIGHGCLFYIAFTSNTRQLGRAV